MCTLPCMEFVKVILFGLMNVLYPKLRLAWLPAILGYAVLGAILAGIYGVLHDQATYSISHEYFARLKFSQFHCADFGFPPLVFVAEIGFLATWWVGFFAAWFVARITVPAFSPSVRSRRTIHALLIVLGFALTSSVLGYALGMLHGPDYSAWQDLASTLGVIDVAAFVRVAYIHYASYLGAVAGLIAAIIYLRKLRKNRATCCREHWDRAAIDSRTQLRTSTWTGTLARYGTSKPKQRIGDVS